MMTYIEPNICVLVLLILIIFQSHGSIKHTRVEFLSSFFLTILLSAFVQSMCEKYSEIDKPVSWVEKSQSSITYCLHCMVKLKM